MWFAGALARAECARPTSTAGALGFSYGAAEVRSFGNERALVWYTLDGPHAVRPASTRGDGVPDDVALAAEVTAEALASYAALGYRAPLSDGDSPACGGDARLDVYLVHMAGADGTTALDEDRCRADGATLTCPAFVLAQADLTALYPTAEIGARTVLPHEVFHAVQDAYDANLDRFWAEGTAQWAADQLDPSLTDLERFLPSWFAQVSRSLDAPPNGVTAAFLYGAAIWPVYLTTRFGAGVVRAILDEEAASGASALEAADRVLAAQQSSLGREYPQFAVWNAATGARAGAGGYPDAAHYPEVALTELDDGAQAITAGLGSFYYHLSWETPMTVSIETDLQRNAATLVPLEAGLARLDQAVPLPATHSGEAIVVVSGTTTQKTDAPFRLTVSAPADEPAPTPAASGGCSSAPGRPANVAPIALAALLLLLAACSSKSPAPDSKPAAKPTPRIVSVGGAVTETLFALGAGADVIADDTSSVYPAAAVQLPHVGYQRTLAAEAILSLRPTLVLAANEAGPPAALEQLRSAGVRVEVIAADPTVAGAHERITKLAALLGRDPKPLLATLDRELAEASALAARARSRPRVLALYTRGGGTLFGFGAHTAASAMLALAAADNALAAVEGPKPIAAESLVEAAPEVVLLPSRGLESVGGEAGLLALPGLAQTPAGRHKRVVALDDLLLLGFGPRTGQAVRELVEKLHPELAAQVAP